MSLFFSVIIPTHRREKSLEILLESLESQNFNTDLFEVIVVPSHGDDCLKNIKKFNLNLTVLTPEEIPNYNQNVSHKRNCGTKNAKGVWLAFTDDDCICDANWLQSAYDYILKHNPKAVEGKTVIPHEDKITLTYKGLKRLENAGGFQTCNIFYRKDILTSIGGFDSKNFPWYLEDSDAAWSVIELSGAISCCETAVVFHPNKEPAPWRLLHEAKGARIKATLFAKHKNIFKSKNMKIMRLNYYLYLFFYLIFFVGVFKLNIFLITLGFLASLLLLSVHMAKLFRNCSTNFDEVSKTAFYTALVPIYTFWYLIVGVRENKLSWIESLSLFRI